MTSRMVTSKNVLGFLFLLVILLFQTQTLQASKGVRIIDIDDDGGSVKFKPTALDDCTYSFTLPLYIANLVKHVGNENGLYNSLPNGVEDIYIHYTIGDDSGIFMVDISQAVYVMDIEGEPIFHYSHSLATSFYGECRDSNDRVYLHWSLRTANGDIYPLEDYSAPGEIFSCQVFIETCGYCSNDCDFPPTSPEWNQSIWPECCTCVKGTRCFDDPTEPKDTTITDEEHAERNAVLNATPVPASVSLAANPNPFQSSITLDISLPDQTNFGIQIYNANGQLVLSQKEVFNSGLYQTTISTDSWPSGIYYVKVNSPYGQQTQKLVKTY